jgi:tetratricopeptide (TPR) repeat protein/regulation of enolase protein 1 (concanavalin A-like superfamily)
MAALRAEGLDPAEIDRALKSYTRQVAYRGTSRAARIDLGGEFSARDVSEAEWLAACGAFLVHRGRAADGASLLDKAEQKQPDLATVQRARGLALYREGRLDEARERLQRATRLDPSDPAGWLLAGLFAQTAASTSEMRAVARAHLERALELAPEHAVAHQLLAETLLAQGEVPAAVDHALRAARLEPGSGQHRLTLARTLAAAGRTSEARAQAEKAAGLGLDAAGNAAGLALLTSLADARESVQKTSSSPPDASEAPSKAAGAIPVVSNVRPPAGRPAAWGVFVDTDGGARLAERGGHVQIGVPAGAYDLSAEIGKVNAPRLLRPAVGDFIAQVTVSRVPQPDRRQALPGRAPFNGAGLLLWQDDRNYVRLELGVFIVRDGTTVRFALFEQRREGIPVGGLSKTQTRLAAVPTSLRLERRGRTLLGFVRQGSEDWIPLGQFEADLPPTVYVGVAAVNATQSPFTAEFEDLTVVPRH